MKKLLFLSLAYALGSASPATADTIPQDLQSRHFQAMNQHLDLGGVLYGYVDVDGDLDVLTKLADDFMGMLRQVDPEEFPLEIDLKRVMAATGLDAIKGIGASSYKNGAKFRNKVFILAPGERRGLLKLGGDKPHAFKSWKLAPLGADLVVEQDLNGKAIYEMVLDIAEIVMGELGRGMVEAQVKQSVPDMPFTIEKIINNLDLRITVVVDMQEKRPLRIPDSPEPGVTIPLTDAIVVIENMGWLVDHLFPMARQEEDLRVFRDLQWEGIEMMEEIPGDFSIYSPGMMKHLRTGNLVFATRREFAQRCFSDKQTLSEDPKFQAAMAGLPKKGNSCSYVSTALHKAIADVFKQIPEEEGGVEASIMVQLVSLLLPAKNGPEASVTVNLPEGFLTIGNSGSSLKTSFASGALVGPLMMGYSMVIPMMMMEEAFIDEAEFIEEFDFEEGVPIPVEPTEPLEGNLDLLEDLEAPTRPGDGD